MMKTTTATAAIPIALTPREQEIVILFSEGLSAKDIAKRLGLCEATVRVYCSKLYHKTGKNRLQLAVLAAQAEGHLKIAVSTSGGTHAN